MSALKKTFKKRHGVIALLLIAISLFALFFLLGSSTPRYSSVSASSCGRWAVVGERRRGWGNSNFNYYGVIDVISGEKVIPLAYGQVRVSSGFALVREGPRNRFQGYRDMRIIDLESGDTIFTHPVTERDSPSFSLVSDRVIVVRLGGSPFIINFANGRRIVPARPSATGGRIPGASFSHVQFFDDVAVIYDGTERNTSFFFTGAGTFTSIQRNPRIMDLETGYLLLSATSTTRFRNIFDIRDGMATVEFANGTQGIIHIASDTILLEEGQFEIDSENATFSLIGNGRAVVSKFAEGVEGEMQWAHTVVDIESGEIIIPFFQFHEISETGVDDFLLVRKDRYYGIIHAVSGEEIIPIAHRHIGFYSGLALIWDAHWEFSIVDLKDRTEENRPTSIIRFRDIGREDTIIDLARGIEVILAPRDYMFIQDRVDNIALVLDRDEDNIMNGILIDLTSGEELFTTIWPYTPTLFANGVVAMPRRPFWGGPAFWTFQRIEDLIETQ